MATRLYSVVFDSADPAASSDWWSEALQWPVTYADDDEVVVTPPEDAADLDLALVFVRVPEPKRGKNRVHLDLASASTGDQVATVGRLLDLGATFVDVGQRDVTWEVLADPDGNEFCVLGPNDRFDKPGRLEAIVVDTVSPAALAGFWAAAAGWHVESSSRYVAGLRHPSSRPPALDLVAVPDPTPGKNRVHLDLAPAIDDDHDAEVDRLLRLGAHHADVGQGDDVTWVVLADPEGNEFCVLTPR